MLVTITENATGKVAANIPLLAGNVDCAPLSERQCFDEAWKSAVEDRLVAENERENYSFSIRN